MHSYFLWIAHVGQKARVFLDISYSLFKSDGGHGEVVGCRAAGVQFLAPSTRQEQARMIIRDSSFGEEC